MDMEDEMDDADPSICFVKAYARKPIGAPYSNLIPLGNLGQQQNGIDWNHSYFYNMMDEPNGDSSDEYFSGDESDSEYYSEDECSSCYDSEDMSSSGSEYSDDYSGSSGESNDIGFDDSDENDYYFDEMDGIYYYDNDYYEEDNEVLGFSSDEDNEIADDLDDNM